MAPLDSNRPSVVELAARVSTSRAGSSTVCHGEAANQPSTSTTKSPAPPARYSEMLPSAPTGTMVMFAVVVPGCTFRVEANGRGPPDGYTDT